jgi:hypothetical protein
MKRKTVLCLLSCLVMFVSVRAQLVYGTQTLQRNWFLNILQNNKTQLPVGPGSNYLTRYVPNCTMANDSMDVFFVSNDCGTCMFYCECAYFGSARPFYLVKFSVNTWFFSSPLYLQDTVLFKSIERIQKSDTCYLPAIATTKSGFNPGMPSRNFDAWYVFSVQRAGRNLYALAQVISDISDGCGYYLPGYCNSYVYSVAVQWYLQTNGTIDFHGVFTPAVVSHPLSVPLAKNSFEVFDILGKRIEHVNSLSQLKNIAYKGLYLIRSKEANSPIRKVLQCN